MKKFCLAIILAALAAPAFAQNECTSQGLATYRTATGADGVNHQVICIDYLNGKLSFPWAAGVSLQSIGNIRFADQFAGADLGAKINAAFADCVANLGAYPTLFNSGCRVIVDAHNAGTTTISTSVSFPAPGYTLEFLGGVYNLSSGTRILVNHRADRLIGNGADFDFTDASGNFALQVGKQVNFDGGTASIANGSPIVTWVSGPLFDFDLGDSIVINGNTYNISTGTTTSLTLTQNVSGGSGTFSYFGIINPFPGLHKGQDLEISGLTFVGRATNGGMYVSGLVRGLFNNLMFGNNQGATEAIKLVGVQGATFNEIKVQAAAHALHFPNGGGASWLISTTDMFYNLDIESGLAGAGNYAINQEPNNSSLTLIGGIIEGNASDGPNIIFAGTNNLITGNMDIEQNGSTAAAVDLSITGTGNTIENNTFAGLAGGTAISIGGAATATTLNNVKIIGVGTGYATAYSAPLAVLPRVFHVTTSGTGALAVPLAGDVVSRENFIGTAPTCTFTTGGGTNPNCSMATGSTDSAGRFSLISGTGTPAALGTGTLTFSSAFGAHFGICVFTLSNAATSWQARATVISVTNTTGSVTFNWDNNGVALTVSSSYAIAYHCSGV